MQTAVLIIWMFIQLFISKEGFKKKDNKSKNNNVAPL